MASKIANQPLSLEEYAKAQPVRVRCKVCALMPKALRLAAESGVLAGTTFVMVASWLRDEYNLEISPESLSRHMKHRERAV